MNGIRTAVANLYSANGREIKAALMDTATVFVGMLLLWTLYLQAHNYNDGFSLINMRSLVIRSLLTFPLSLIGIRVFALWAAKPPKARNGLCARSTKRTALAIMGMMTLATVASLLARQDFSFNGLQIAFVFSAFIGVPMAIRLTAYTKAVYLEDVFPGVQLHNS